MLLGDEKKWGRKILGRNIRKRNCANIILRTGYFLIKQTTQSKFNE
jgi:hypothetical protein